MSDSKERSRVKQWIVSPVNWILFVPAIVFLAISAPTVAYCLPYAEVTYNYGLGLVGGSERITSELEAVSINGGGTQVQANGSSASAYIESEAYGGTSPAALTNVSINMDAYYSASGSSVAAIGMARNIYGFLVTATDGNIPESLIGSGFEVPLLMAYSLSVSGDSNSTWYAVARLDCSCPTSSFTDGISRSHSTPGSLQKEDTISLFLKESQLDSIYEIELYAYTSIRLYSDFYNAKYGYASAFADPVITIDPTWQYASYFNVNQFSLTPPSSTVPEPGTMLLLGSGLAGLVVLRKRFKN
ncbi:MAG: PEP-CTERM sorting domain-containing protein [Candidatus Methylomirabilis sp.]|nr:PEP-CTERM sorting domain-containing protein [Deltaproteobacteria bacterium]